eukprot:1142407-Pelagomonas_calceolata.AAC.9
MHPEKHVHAHILHSPEGLGDPSQWTPPPLDSSFQEAVRKTDNPWKCGHLCATNNMNIMSIPCNTCLLLHTGIMTGQFAVKPSFKRTWPHAEAFIDTKSSHKRLVGIIQLITA